MLRHQSKHKSIDHAVALNFQHRCEDKEYGVIQSVEKDHLVVPTNHPTFAGEDFEKLLDSYAFLDYERIEQILVDRNLLLHWESIKGMFSVADGKVLRFILALNIPLDKFIRYELAARGYDEDHKWVGFPRAKKIWLK